MKATSCGFESHPRYQVNIMNTITIIVLEKDNNKRADIFITQNSSLTRSRVQDLIERGFASNNQNVILKSSQKVETGNIYLTIPDPQKVDLSPQNIPLNIIYQDSDIAVINKQAGIVVHAAAGNKDGTLVNALLFHIKDLSGIGGEIRPGIVHRLDKNTSGLMVIAKNDHTHINLSQQFKDREVEKRYYAVVKGTLINKRGRVENLLERDKRDRKKMSVSNNGKKAITEYNVIKEKKNSLLDITIETGRTHQIRVHMSYLGHPIIGDEIYGKKDRLNRHLLHCYYLAFTHPTSNKKVVFNINIPIDFNSSL